MFRHAAVEEIDRRAFSLDAASLAPARQDDICAGACFERNAVSKGARGYVAGLSMNIVEPIFAQTRNKPSELALCARAPAAKANFYSGVSGETVRNRITNLAKQTLIRIR